MTRHECATCEAPLAARVRRFLTLSTVHLPPGALHRDVFNEGEIRGAVVYGVRFGSVSCEGLFLWVPPDPVAHAQELDEDERPEEWLLKIQVFARKLGCDYVLFDPDGEEEEGLETFDEEETLSPGPRP